MTVLHSKFLRLRTTASKDFVNSGILIRHTCWPFSPENNTMLLIKEEVHKI